MIQRSNIGGGQIIQVGGGLDQSLVDELVQHRRPQAVDIHGIAAGEMGEIPQTLSWTFRTGAAQGRAVRVPLHRCAAHGTGLGQIIGRHAAGTAVRHHLHDLGDDLSGLLHHHRVADANVLLGDIVLVVQGGKGNGGARQTNGLQLRLGGQNAGAAHLDHDVPDAGGLALRRVFESNGPSGTLGGTAQYIAV